jgi:uncharacterized protein involved in exopolysaccharide biosynthesis
MNDDPTKDLPSNDALKSIFALIQGMSEQLSALQLKVDERLYDTRPLWENVQSQINDLRSETEQGFRQVRAEMEQGFEKLRAELSRELRHLSNSIDTIAGNMVRFDAIQRDIESSHPRH